MTASVALPKDTFERANRLLAIDSLSDMSDEELAATGADTYQSETIFCVGFPDGSEAVYSLCSGSENYWDDLSYYAADGSCSQDFEPEYELEKEICFFVGHERYVIHLELIDSKP